MLDPSANSRLELLGKHAASTEVVERWRGFLEQASDADLNPIDPKGLAERWKLDSRAVLGELLSGTRAGLFDLAWNVVCAACGKASAHEGLATVCSIANCDACGTRFEVFLDKNVEVEFTAHPGLRTAATSGGAAPRSSSARTRISGLDVAVLPEFREFFSSDVLSAEESLKVGDVTIMFTDIKGSTSMYETLGDARAFSAVRRHFHAMFEAIAEHGGSVVKTIGDALMVNFARADQAVLAALSVQEVFREFRPLLPDADDAIVLKIGIHRGPCLVVTLNDRLDYFGTTVNVAARVLNFSKGGDVAVTDAIVGDSAVSSLLARRDLERSDFETHLRGLSTKFRVHVLRSANPAGRPGRNADLARVES